MDHNRFDDLTRALASGMSRRQALKLLGGSLMGGLLSFSGLGTVFAKPKQCTANGKHCNSKTVCCSGFCDSTTKTCACPPGQTFVNGSCCLASQVCGSVCCSGTCDNNQCTCPSSCQVLANGTCAQRCTGVPDSCTCGGSSGSVCAGDSSQPQGFGVCSPNGAAPTGTCTSDIDCPPGSFCNTNSGPPALCFPACC